MLRGSTTRADASWDCDRVDTTCDGPEVFPMIVPLGADRDFL